MDLPGLVRTISTKINACPGYLPIYQNLLWFQAKPQQVLHETTCGFT